MFLTFADEDEWNADALAAVTKKPRLKNIKQTNQIFLIKHDRNIATTPIYCNQKNPFEILHPLQFKHPTEIDFATFQQMYKNEMKEKYLLNQICAALEKINKNQKVCSFIKTQIEAAQWAQDDLKWNENIYKEFDRHIKLLTISCNSHSIWANEDWETLQYLLRCVAQKERDQIWEMLGIK